MCINSPPFSENNFGRDPADGEKRVLTTKSAVNTNTPTGTLSLKRRGIKSPEEESPKKAPSEPSEVVRFPFTSLNEGSPRLVSLSTGTKALISSWCFKITLNWLGGNLPVRRPKGASTVEKIGCAAMLTVARRPSTQAKKNVDGRIVRRFSNGIRAEFAIEEYLDSQNVRDNIGVKQKILTRGLMAKSIDLYSFCHPINNKAETDVRSVHAVIWNAAKRNSDPCVLKMLTPSGRFWNGLFHQLSSASRRPSDVICCCFLDYAIQFIDDVNRAVADDDENSCREVNPHADKNDWVVYINKTWVSVKVNADRRKKPNWENAVGSTKRSGTHDLQPKIVEYC